LFSNKKLKNCESSVPQFFYHHLHHVLYLTRLEKAGAKTENPQRLGVNPNDAYSWSRIRMGGWAVAQSPIMGTTITLSRLKRRGYESNSIIILKFVRTTKVNRKFSPMFDEPPDTLPSKTKGGSEARVCPVVCEAYW